MVVIPAIDLREGRCVRLLQGDFQQSTVYSDNPSQMALQWKRQGAERLHVVDLDGSLKGAPCHERVINTIVKETGLPVQVGGGIRTMATVEAYLAMGVRWVILGTSAFRDPAFVREACRRFPGQVILGIDALAGKLAVQGWMEKTQERAVDLARRFSGDGPAAIVYTDIQRDGTQSGVNLASTGELAEAAGIPVIASGGVAGLSDIERLLPLEEKGVVGAVVGKALYTGALSLEAAIACSRRNRCGTNAGDRDRKASR
ncbi:MAG: 1-(5-phosphoribosyl)-5-[(5-phosphoribosylamino)methylideneamino]imidazole-4-carboxamide isomerase [Syntrophaceae bacterium]|nr:1-(5-phosphoribosyl)-5-[(5-phosphoribosylamino)methylideneamino]imidazole-4-carboxamide isomerase [Syntrophaceae bacterium]